MTLPAKATASDLARFAVAFFFSAIVLGFDEVLWGFPDPFSTDYSPFQLSLALADIALVYVAASCLVLGVAFLVASIGERRREQTGQSQAPTPAPAIWSDRLRAAFSQPSVRLRSRALASLAVALMMSALALVGLFDIYLWRPLALVPGLSIDEIYAAMRAANQIASHNLSIAWAVYCMLGAAGFAVFALVPPLARALSARALLLLALTSLATGIMGFPWAGFHMVWQLGDTFYPLEHNMPTAGKAIHLIGQTAWAAIVFLVVAPWRRLGTSLRRTQAHESL
ncbi:hypothetical protein V6245_09430 [Salinibacterium amurskyense]|uniref:hypothetical protein n=1 Tax=Salinibacterium amurskyense TaxID=205941 RepID=UPI00311D4E00